MAKLTYKLTGIKNLEKKFQKFGEEGEKALEKITRSQAIMIVADAKQIVGSNVFKKSIGKLKQNISPREITSVTYDIVASERYAPFVEFGTGRLVEVPTELKSYALQFKGKGIKEVNLPARPFLYPATKRGFSNYIKDVRKLYIRLSKKFNQ